MRPFSYEPPNQRVVFGAGAAARHLAAECERLGMRRLLVIATPGEHERVQAVLTPLTERTAGTFTAVRPHVPLATAAAARRQAEQVVADGLLSIGGGSTTGTAKAVALELGLPILAVPTTYAGSEVTPVWGLTAGQRKTTGRSPLVLPRTVVYDPELTLSLPADVTAASGMNAVAHCVEALTLPNTDPITALYAEEGIRVLARALPAAVQDGADIDARGEVMFGGYLAGTAFATAGSGVHHKMCHVLGGRFDLPHAATHTVLLPHVAARLCGDRAASAAAADPAAASRVANALGVEDVATGLYELARRIGAPLALRDIGLADSDLEEAVDLVVEHVGLSKPDARRILRAAQRGWPPR